MNKSNLTENTSSTLLLHRCWSQRSIWSHLKCFFCEIWKYFVPFQVFLCEIWKYLVPFQVLLFEIWKFWSHFKCFMWNLKGFGPISSVFCAILQFWKKDKNEMNEQPTQSTPIYIWWKSNPNWDIKEAAQQTVCRDQECYRCLGAIGDCPELNI